MIPYAKALHEGGLQTREIKTDPVVPLRVRLKLSNATMGGILKGIFEIKESGGFSRYFKVIQLS
jgi:hypothetical protein